MIIGNIEVNVVSSSWKKIARTGNKIAAIRALWEEKNKKHPNMDDPLRMGLREAKEYIENWMVKHNIKEVC